MKKALLTASALIACITASPSSAADFSGFKAPLAAPSGMSWTGCYVGAAGGGGGGFNSVSGGFDVGGLAGGQVGCNYQVNGFVAGIEGEGFWSGINSTTGNTTNYLDPTTGAVTSTYAYQTYRKLDDLWDVAIRFGYTSFDRTLIYGKLGAVWGHNTATYSDNSFDVTTWSWTAPGVLIGGGFEYAITNNWIARFETDLLFFRATNAAFVETYNGIAGEFGFAKSGNPSISLPSSASAINSGEKD